jgi:hypothetical protein
MATQEIIVSDFKGLKNDENIKQIPNNYFYDILNFNFSNEGLLGIEKITFPERINAIIQDKKIDGLFEYKYLDKNNILQTEFIGVCNGCIYKDILTTPILLKTGLDTGKVSFSILNDQLFIANGKNYIQVYNGEKGIIKEMGAPFAEISTIGALTGVYYYAMTYVTAGGEEVVGSVSNTITLANEQVLLTLPIGYTGVTSRKIYRTTAGGSSLKLLTTIANNTTLTFLDNIADGSLTTDIPVINNEIPIPFFLLVANQKLFGSKVLKYPTQVFVTDTNIELFDSASFIDVSNYGFDNTPINGLGFDYNKIIVGSNKNIFFIDPSDNSVILTRANIGIKDGYSIVNIPANGEFPGGLMFVSTLNDIRLMSGLQALPVSTSLDNVYTGNWSQSIKGTLNSDVQSASNIYAIFYKYKYHLLLNNKKYVFDIRKSAWTIHNIQTENYLSSPSILAILNEDLYNGQNDGWIEKEYCDNKYRDEEVLAYLESPYFEADRKYKLIEDLSFWIESGNNAEIKLTIEFDDNIYNKIENTFISSKGCFDNNNFIFSNFDINSQKLNYKIVNIYKNIRWIKYKIEVLKGAFNYQNFGMRLQLLNNKE